MIDLLALRTPLDPKDLEWRVLLRGDYGWDKRNGRIWIKPIPYVNKNAVFARFNEVCGIENWSTSIVAVPGDPEKNACGFLCTLEIRIDLPGKDNGWHWVGKTDGAPMTDFESFKGGVSDALKRAAKQWGFGEYLDYVMRDPGINPFCTAITEKPSMAELPFYATAVIQDIRPEDQRGKSRSGKVRVYFKPPQLPAWALPEGYVYGGTTTPTSRKASTTKKTKTASKAKSKQEPNRDAIVAELSGIDAILKKMTPAQVSQVVAFWSAGELGGLLDITTVEEASNLVDYVQKLSSISHITGKPAKDLTDDITMWSADGKSHTLKDISRHNIGAFYTWILKDYPPQEEPSSS